MLFIALAFAATQGVTISGKDKSEGVPHATASAVECAAFRKNADGSWTSIRDTKIGPVSMSAGATFFAGATVDGVDVGATLNTKCHIDSGA